MLVSDVVVYILLIGMHYIPWKKNEKLLISIYKRKVVNRSTGKR